MNIKLLFLFVFISFQSFGQTHQLIITEIMADPTPSKGLPEREYLEIYNPSPNDISLKNFKLYYGSFSASFPDSIIKSNAYAIVFRKGYEAEFRDFGPIIPLPNFSLSNEGSLLVLKNDDGQDVFYIDYSSNWHTLKNDGGISLEMIDTGFACVKEQNWATSANVIGGTPGKVNSVKKENSDILAPKLLNFNVDNDQVILNFDENLSKDFLSKRSNFSIVDSPHQILEIVFNPYKTSQVVVRLNASLEIGEMIKLKISNLTDCSGNSGEDIEVEFWNLLPAVKGEILLSEVLFNPRIGGEDFVEVYNISNKTLNLKKWKLAKLETGGQISDITELISYDLLLKPKGFVAFTTGKSFLTDNYPKTGNVVEVQQMPAYNNEEGIVVLLNDQGEEFERFAYNEKNHHELVVNSKGISLERTNLGAERAIWTSASSDYGFATPGFENSQTLTDALQNIFYAEPIIFNPYQVNENNTTKLKYQLNSAGSSASVEVLNKNGVAVKKLLNNFTLGTQGEIEWDGKDNNGQLLPVGYYVFKITVYSSKFNQSFLAKCVLGSN
ncbi:MAG: lamin tail domain-containing protein [Leadbetterella sp.]|nr:lamin tail domain-containing protein [Leadbetterella sp.]